MAISTVTDTLYDGKGNVSSSHKVDASRNTRCNLHPSSITAKFYGNLNLWLKAGRRKEEVRLPPLRWNYRSI